MKRNKKRVLVALLAICALAAGGAAYTAAITGFPADNTATAGFAQTEIQGATAAGVTYGLSSDGQWVHTADIYFTTNVTGDNVQAGFGTSTTNASLIGCTTNSTPVASGTYVGDYDTTCTFTGTTTYGAHGAAVDQANYFAASVTDTNGDVTGVVRGS